MNVLCSLHMLRELTKWTVVGTALSLALTVGMPAIGPGDSQVLFSPSHWCRSTEVRSQYCGSHAPGPAVGAMEATRTLVCPYLHVYMPTELTTAKARPVPVARVLVVLSDVSQALNLGSPQWGCNSTVHTAARRDFSSSSLVT